MKGWTQNSIYYIKADTTMIDKKVCVDECEYEIRVCFIEKKNTQNRQNREKINLIQSLDLHN